MTDIHSDAPRTKGEAFFLDRPFLFETTRTIPSLNRLASRYDAIIGWNRHLFAGTTVVDLAAHDGRWSLAALDAGAARCITIEARESLVASTRANAERLGLSDRMEVLQADALDGLSGLTVEGDVVVFCLGFYYHTMDHMRLLLEAARLGSATIVIDTGIVDDLEPVIRLMDEPTEDHRNTIQYGSRDQGTSLVGVPSASALDAMLRQAGYVTERYDWHSDPNRDWSDIYDYQIGRRVTVRGCR